MNNKMVYKQKQIYSDTFPLDKPDNVSQMCWLESEPRWLVRFYVLFLICLLKKLDIILKEFPPTA